VAVTRGAATAVAGQGTWVGSTLNDCSRKGPTRAIDPNPPAGLLQSCPTASPGAFVLRIQEAAVHDYQQPAEAV